MKKIYVINGMAGSGKDTFVGYLSALVPTKHISMVDCVKAIAKQIGWDGKKTEKDRKFLSDLKILIDNYNDMNLNYVKDEIESFLKDDSLTVLCIDMREAKDIHRLRQIYPLETILIYRKDVKNIKSNVADAGVFNMDYDITIDNSFSLDDLKTSVRLFVRNNLAANSSSPLDAMEASKKEVKKEAVQDKEAMMKEIWDLLGRLLNS